MLVKLFGAVLSKWVQLLSAVKYQRKYIKVASLWTITILAQTCLCQLQLAPAAWTATNYFSFLWILVFKIFIKCTCISRTAIDDNSLMHYMIQRIDDTPRNKAILFGCTDFAQFKEKLLIYNEICRSSRDSKARVQHYTPSASQASLPKNENKIIY